MAKILIVDDDENLTSVLSALLKKEKHIVDSVLTGDAGLRYLCEGGYDLAIIDISMPGLDGKFVCKEYREGGGTCRIIMLTGKRSQQDKIEGLDLGADDYVTKPFDSRELLSRVRAQLRRPNNLNRIDALSAGDLCLDLESHQLTCRNKPFKLAPREFALLELFMRNPNKVFSVDSLLSKVWQSDSDAAADAVRNSVNRLRRALKEANTKMTQVETIHLVGYKFSVDDQGKLAVAEDESSS